MSRIIIQLQGGLIADQFLVGKGLPTEVIVINEDTDGAEEDEITKVDLGKRGTYEAIIHAEKLNPLPPDSDVAKMLQVFDKRV
jgi:hypothetical protein